MYLWRAGRVYSSSIRAQQIVIKCCLDGPGRRQAPPLAPCSHSQSMMLARSACARTERSVRRGVSLTALHSTPFAVGEIYSALIIRETLSAGNPCSRDVELAALKADFTSHLRPGFEFMPSKEIKSLESLVVELELVNGEETLKVCCPLVGIQNQRPKRPEVGRNIERDRCLENREAYVAILARAAPL